MTLIEAIRNAYVARSEPLDEILIRDDLRCEFIADVRRRCHEQALSAESILRQALRLRKRAELKGGA